MGRAVSLFNTTLLLLISAAAANAQASTLFPYRAAQYEGSAFNTTARQRGDVTLELYDFEPASGAVRAYFNAYNGLEGEAWLSGSIGSQGELRLSGTLASFRMEVEGRLSAQGTVRASYRLDGPSHQEGTFEVSFRRELRGAAGSGGKSTPGLESLIGAWEVGGALPAQTDPITGATTGVAFVEARRLEILPDGRFKHLLSHEHCGGTGLARCCNQRAVLEEGTLSVEGSQLVLDVTGGMTIVRDACNPALNGQQPAERRHLSLTWSFGAGGSELCVQQGSNEPTCYQRQA